MKILALDTSTEACSAALLANGEVFERYRVAPREHNRLILPMIDEVLAEAGLTLPQLDALAFGRGPGAFTGVRIAVGVAQGIAFAADLPVAPVSTLAALAAEALDACTDAFAFPCIDARMAEVYWAVYRRDPELIVRLVGQEAVVAADAVEFPQEAAGAGIGSGWATYAATLGPRLGSSRVSSLYTDRFPRASWIARLGAVIHRRGGSVQAEQAQPVYLRDRVAKKPGGVW